ncbi:MAG: DUF5652 family protein [Nanoarchaeota archaeon]
MAEGLSLITSALGIPLWIFFFILIWEMVWKLLAMWKAAKKDSVAWFICLMLFNTAGILPILYIYVFSKLKKSKKPEKSKKSKK